MKRRGFSVETSLDFAIDTLPNDDYMFMVTDFYSRFYVSKSRKLSQVHQPFGKKYLVEGVTRLSAQMRSSSVFEWRVYDIL